MFLIIIIILPFSTNTEAAFVSQVQRRSLLIVLTPAVFQNEHGFHQPLINSVFNPPRMTVSYILIILLNNERVRPISVLCCFVVPLPSPFAVFTVLIIKQ